MSYWTYPYMLDNGELIRKREKPKPLRVSNAGVRDAAVRAVEAGEITWVDLSAALPGVRDSTRVIRLLGIRPHTASKRHLRPNSQTTITEDQAIALCRALHVYPRDVGL